jgi:NitT/TauT family transport system substrate-binding protein
MKRWLIFLYLLMLGFFGSGCPRDPAAPQPEVRLRQEWFPNANYAGALFAAKDFAEQYGIRIKIEPGSDLIDPIKLLLTGEDMVADVGADKVLLANSKGADLVVIGVLNRSSPTCFIAKASKRIVKPKDFEGKTIGILTGTATEYVYHTLVAQQQLDRSRLHEVPVSFDLASFLADAYDVRPAFIYDEPVSLDLQNIPYTIIEPRHYGVEFIGTVYVTTRDNIKNHRQAIQDFMSAAADGWKAAFKYPERAIDLLKEYDSTIDKDRELRSLQKAQSYFLGKDGRVLHAEESDWKGMIAALKELGVLQNVDLDRMIDRSFLANYEDKNRKK